MAYKRNKEVSPLLPTDWLGIPTYRQKPEATHLNREEYLEEVIEDDDEVFTFIDQKKKRNVNMVWIDTALLALDFLQILALIQAMSLRWTYPVEWLRGIYPIFAFNLDIWELMKFVDTNTYKSIQDYNIDSSTVGLDFQLYAIIWFCVMAFIWLAFGIMYLIMRLSFYPSINSRRVMSWIQFGYLIFMHAITLPFGTVLFKLFQCTTVWYKVDVLNNYDCFGNQHWNLVGPAIVFIVILFLVYPISLIWIIRKECLSGTSKGHLTFILMKETEYKIHLNWSWLLDGLFVFSSFKYRGMFYRPMIHFLKLILLIICAGAYTEILTQSICLTVILLVAAILFVILRPYRLTSCNLFLIFSLLSLTGFAFLGALKSTYTPVTLASPWLLPQYVIWFLSIVLGLWGVSLIALIVYLVSRTVCHSTKSCYKRPVWPNISSSGDGHLTPETKKFMTALIRAKLALDKIRRTLPMFAPVYDLGRHIQILNAYTREAEILEDALHPDLWEVLDDLIETHAEIAPKSLFADTVKKSIRKTAAEFLTMVPMFSQRLAQRDYDFILVPPWKRRVLLKMYILGLFLNGRAEKMARGKVLEPALQKVWPPLPAGRDYEEEDGYYEDLYPNPIEHGFTDNILNVVVQDSSDGESTADEDNVEHMLRDLPEIEFIDLNKISDSMLPDVPTTSGSSRTDSSDVTIKALTPDSPHPSPMMGGTRRLSSVSTQDVNKTTPAFDTLSPVPFGSSASLREQLTPNMGSSRPSSASSSFVGSRVISPVPSRPVSAQSGTSYQSHLSSRPVSSDHELGNINPGYIPDDSGEDTHSSLNAMGGNSNGTPEPTGFNQHFDEDQTADAESIPALSSRKKEKERKKKKKRNKEEKHESFA